MLLCNHNTNVAISVSDVKMKCNNALLKCVILDHNYVIPQNSNKTVFINTEKNGELVMHYKIIS